MAAFQLYLQRGKQRKVGSVGDESHVFEKKFPNEKGNVIRCVVVMQQPAILSPNFGEKCSHFFKQSP
jgi:hypothetical protein